MAAPAAASYWSQDPHWGRFSGAKADGQRAPVLAPTGLSFWGSGERLWITQAVHGHVDAREVYTHSAESFQVLLSFSPADSRAAAYSLPQPQSPTLHQCH